MVRILIKQATIVSSFEQKVGDVLIEDSKIVRVDPVINEGSDQVIDAKGLHLLPGVLDPQVHFRDPGATWKEDLETGSRAAAAGGVTSFFEMPNTKPSTTTRQAMADKKSLAAQKSLVNYNFFIGATPHNLEEINAVENVCGIKIFMGASTGDLLVHRFEDLERIFAHGRRLIAVHSEDEETIRANKLKYKDSKDVMDHMHIRSVEAAVKSTQVALALSRQYQRRLHILHLSTADEIPLITEAKKHAPVTVEVCPQHFLLHAPDVYKRLGTYAQMNPPLRDLSHASALWKALVAGDIDMIATDHAPHTHEEKQQPFGEAPSGMPGVETSLPLMLNQVSKGLCSLQDVVRWMCEHPVLMYGVCNKGFVKPGYDADIVLVDMQKEKIIRNGQLQCKVNWSPYDGWNVQGWPVMTFVNGHVVFREGDFFEDIKGKEIEIKPQWEQDKL